MIRVRAATKGGALVRIQATGHAGYADSGSDIVCAAVTAVMATTYTALTDLLDLEVEGCFEAGWLSIALTDADDAASRRDDEKIAILMDSCLLGLRQIAESYGRWVRVEEVEDLSADGQRTTRR